MANNVDILIKAKDQTGMAFQSADRRIRALTTTTNAMRAVTTRGIGGLGGMGVAMGALGPKAAIAGLAITAMVLVFSALRRTVERLGWGTRIWDWMKNVPAGTKKIGDVLDDVSQSLDRNRKYWNEVQKAQKDAAISAMEANNVNSRAVPILRKQIELQYEHAAAVRDVRDAAQQLAVLQQKAAALKPSGLSGNFKEHQKALEAVERATGDYNTALTVQKERLAAIASEMVVVRGVMADLIQDLEHQAAVMRLDLEIAPFRAAAEEAERTITKIGEQVAALGDRRLRPAAIAAMMDPGNEAAQVDMQRQRDEAEALDQLVGEERRRQDPSARRQERAIERERRQIEQRVKNAEASEKRGTANQREKNLLAQQRALKAEADAKRAKREAEDNEFQRNMQKTALNTEKMEKTLAKIQEELAALLRAK